MVDSSGKLQRFLQGLKHLRERAGSSMLAGLPDAEDYGELLGARGAPQLFLGTYSEQGVVDGLERLGVLKRLRELELADFEVQFDTSHPDHHTLRLISRDVKPRSLLAEATLHVGSFETEVPFARALHGRELRMLYVLWLLMRNPRGRFTPERPVMPGQELPGLNVSHEVDRLFNAMAVRLKCHGIINRPEFLHAAIIYSKSYRFFDPAIEGRLVALRRDIGHLGLARASWAMSSGCVRLISEDPPQDVHWDPEEQILPIEQPLVDYFASAQYQQARDEAAGRLKFGIDEARLAGERFFSEDGSPLCPANGSAV